MNQMQAIDRLMQEGFRLLREGDNSGAIRVGRQLKKLRHSSAFEIMAIGYRNQDRLAGAIAVLEEGVRRAGQVWVLWELLGNYYSDAGRFGQAQKAYQRAFACPRCDTEAVNLNRGIAFSRAGKIHQALDAVKRVRSRRLSRRADALRIRLLLDVGKSGAAKHLAIGLARTKPRPSACDDSETEAEIRLACANAFQEAKMRCRALRMVKRAIALEPGNTEALTLLRTIRNRRSQRSKLFRLLVHGRWAGPLASFGAAPGFFRNCEVVAEDENSGLSYLRELETPKVRGSLSIDQSRVLKECPSWLEGLYSISGRFFYPWRKRR